jgi:hypothetical protein
MTFLDRFTAQFNDVVGVSLVNILVALVVLVVGILLAFVISRVVRGLIEKTGLDRRITGWVAGDERRAEGEEIHVASGIGTAVFWLLMLVVLIVFFQILGLGVVTATLNDILFQILAFLPNLIAAGLLILLAWVVASALKWIVLRALRAANVDERVGSEMREPDRSRAYADEPRMRERWEDDRSRVYADEPRRREDDRSRVYADEPRRREDGRDRADTDEPRRRERRMDDRRDYRDEPRRREDDRRPSIAETVATAVYWLVFLFFLPAILGALNLGGLLAPVQGMIGQILGFIPNLFAAGLILVIGWFAARIIRRVVSSLLTAVGVDRLGQRVGLSTADRRLSDLLGLVVYILVLIPVVVAALNALNIAAVTQPAANMLNSILLAIPNIFAAAAVLFVSYLIARVVAGLVENLLRSVGFDDMMARLGWRTRTDTVRMANPLEPDAATTKQVTWGPSRVVGGLVVVVIMLFALTEAFNLLGFVELSLLMSGLIVFVAQVVLGLIIFGIGLYLANMAARAIRDSDMANANLLAWIAQGTILVFAGAMALRQMGLANSIINLAFGLLIGAIAVAAALAFGLGGREVAARKLREWTRTVESESADVPPPPTIAPSRGRGAARSYQVPGAAAGGISASGTGERQERPPQSGTRDWGDRPERPDTPREPMP